MLVKDMINAIVDKSLKIEDLANKYDYSDRTIQTKIKKLGFEWVAKEARYEFVGNDESVFDYKIDDVFASKSNVKTSVKNENKVNKDSTKVSNKATGKTTRNNSESASKKTMDSIDRLLAGKKSKKFYRGFYLDSDVMAVIDGLNHGIKSELVNECLRKVFREKGLM